MDERGIHAATATAAADNNYRCGRWNISVDHRTGFVIARRKNYVAAESQSPLKLRVYKEFESSLTA